MLPARLLVPGPGLAPLARHREVGEGALVVEPRDALGAGLEVEPERPFGGDLAEAEVRGGVDAADDGVALLAVAVYPAGRAVLEAGEQPHDVLPPLERHLAALGAEPLAQQGPERGGVDELDPPDRAGRLRFVSTQT